MENKLYSPHTWPSALSNNGFLVGGWYSNTWSIYSGNTDELRFSTTSTRCHRSKHINKELKWNTAERYSGSCGDKVLNLQSHSIQTSRTSSRVVKSALCTQRKTVSVDMNQALNIKRYILYNNTWTLTKLPPPWVHKEILFCCLMWYYKVGSIGELSSV